MNPECLSRDQIAERVRALGAWFHNLDLCGVQTAPEHFLGDFPRSKWQRFAHVVPRDLTGKTVLDVGCNAGFYAIEMKKRGAARVVGIDTDDTYLEQARFASRVSGTEIELVKMSVYEVPCLRERFDVVLFMGVLYHLRHPLLALDLLHDHAVGELLLFQSMQRGPEQIAPVEDDYAFEEEAMFEVPGMPRMQFIERRFAGDPTNWWVPNRACVEAMLRSSGFDVMERPEEDVYWCRRQPVRATEDAS